MAFGFICSIHSHLWATTLAQPTLQGPCWGPGSARPCGAPQNLKQCLDISYGKCRGSQTELRSIWEWDTFPNLGTWPKVSSLSTGWGGHWAWCYLGTEEGGFHLVLGGTAFSKIFFELPSPVNKAMGRSLQNTAVGSLAEEFTARGCYSH